MRDLAVLIPTRGRPENIRKVIAAWDFTNAWDHADMILIVDADDPEHEGYHALFEETRHPDTDEPLFSLVTMDTWMPMVHKLNRVAETTALSWTYFALGFAGDDHLPRTIGWAERYLTVLRELGTGMVYGDDGYQGKKLSTEWAVTSDAVRVLGRMVPAPVEHMYCDNSILELFTAVGAVRYLPEIRIEHMNPYANRKGEMDEQYKRVNSREQFHRDRLSYTKWQRQQLSKDVNELLALRPKQIFVPDRRRSLAPTQRKATQSMGIAPKILKNVRGATPDEIGVTLADLAVRVPHEQAIVEIGVFQGRTALLLAWGAQQGNGAHVWAVDPWDLTGNTYGPPFTDEGSKNWARYNVRATGFSNHVTLVQGFSLDVAANWVSEQLALQIGLLFVDGDHSYEGARGDVLAWAPHLSADAVIAIDDYGHPDWPGVKEAVDALVKEGVLEPIEIFHERLAVTRLVADPEPGPAPAAARTDAVAAPAAITSEGVSPVPAGKAEIVPIGPAQTVVFSPPVAAIENSRVRDGELEGVPAGTEVVHLNLGQLRALARNRQIVLGARKDKKSETIQAILDGR